MWESGEERWAGVRQISLHPISLWHPSAHLLSPSILDDNRVLICIPKMLSDMRLPSHCKRLENTENYKQNPKVWATFHVEYCTYHFILLFAPFCGFMRARYWLEYLIAAARAYEQSWGGAQCWLVMEVAVVLDGRWCCYCLFVHISQWQRL